MALATIRRLVVAGAVLLGLLLVAPSSNAQTPQQERSQSQQEMRSQETIRAGEAKGKAIRQEQQQRSETRQQIYGRQLMTRAEIRAYRAKMRSLKTAQERRAFREEHHRQMQERARQRGIALPDMPPAGRGPGEQGRGPGMSNGGGRGPRK